MSHEFYNLSVSKIKRETQDASSIYFDVPTELQEQFKYAAGQYLTLKFDINGEEVRRAYSICTAPSDSSLAVNVKRVNKGLVSNFINDNLKEGDKVEVMVPDGKFTIEFDHSKKRAFYFFASGSGITPIISLISEALEQEPKTSCYLLYGNRNEDCIIFKDRLKELSDKFSGQFYMENTLSRPIKTKAGGIKGLFSKGKESWTGMKGRVDNKRIDQFFEKFPVSKDEAHFFVCGPGAMIDTVTHYLELQDIASNRIHSERFLSTTAPVLVNSQAVESTVKVHLAGKEHQVNVTKDKTILDVLIDEGYDPPYSCTSGACSTCIAKLIDGKVEMDACYALDDDEVKEGFILVCQSRAVTPNVELTFDT